MQHYEVDMKFLQFYAFSAWSRRWHLSPPKKKDTNWQRFSLKSCCLRGTSVKQPLCKAASRWKQIIVSSNNHEWLNTANSFVRTLWLCLYCFDECGPNAHLVTLCADAAGKDLSSATCKSSAVCCWVPLDSVLFRHGGARCRQMTLMGLSTLQVIFACWAWSSLRSCARTLIWDEL